MEIFISYNWKCQGNAIQVYSELCSRNGIKQEVKTVIDIEHLRLYQPIDTFMQNITTTDYAATIICGDYLKARNCMNELFNLYHSGAFETRFMPLVVIGTDVYSNDSLYENIQYWNTRYLETYQMAIELGGDPENPILKEAWFYKELSILIGRIITYIRNVLHIRLHKFPERDNASKEEFDKLYEEVYSLNKKELMKLFEYLDI